MKISIKPYEQCNQTKKARQSNLVTEKQFDFHLFLRDHYHHWEAGKNSLTAIRVEYGLLKPMVRYMEVCLSVFKFCQLYALRDSKNPLEASYQAYRFSSVLIIRQSEKVRDFI